MENQSGQDIGGKMPMRQKLSNINYKLFGAVKGDGEMQPREGWAYSFAGFGQNLICSIVGSYLTVFMTDAIGFGALFVALVMLFTRLFDAASDPIMGSIVDRTMSKWGKCRPYLKWSALPIGIMTILCFLPVYRGDTTGARIGIISIYVIWGMVYTICDVPYWGLSTAMSNDTYRRGNLLTVARLLCTLGAGIVTIVVPQLTSQLTVVDQGLLNEIYLNLQSAGLAHAEILADAGYLAQQAHVQNKLQMIYFFSAIACVVVALPLFYLGFKETRERTPAITNPPSLKHNLKLLLKNKPLLLIVISGVLGSARMIFTYTGGLYFAKYVLSDVVIMGMKGEGIYTLITMAIIPGGLIASLLVPFFTKKMGKRMAFIWTHIIGGVALIIAFVIGISIDKGSYTSVATLVVMFVALVIAGFPSGFSNIVSYAMIGDTVEYLELKTGERAEGICFAMQTFINKVGMAVGAFVGVLAFMLAGVTANTSAALSSSGKDIMWILLMLLAGISFIASAIPMFFYKFNEKEQQEAVSEIERRKAEKEVE